MRRDPHYVFIASLPDDLKEDRERSILKLQAYYAAMLKDTPGPPRKREPRKRRRGTIGRDKRIYCVELDRWFKSTKWAADVMTRWTKSGYHRQNMASCARRGRPYKGFHWNSVGPISPRPVETQSRSNGFHAGAFANKPATAQYREEWQGMPLGLAG